MSRLQAAFAGTLLIASLALATICFYVIGARVSSSIELTDYLLSLKAGEQKAVGYGGEAAAERAEVLFQGREMNDIAFLLTSRGGGRFLVRPVGGEFDELVVQKPRLGIFLAHRSYRVGDSVEIRSGQSFVTKGILGRAAFRLVSEAHDSVRLHLSSPVARPVPRNVGRLTLAPEYAGSTQSPIDEVFFRTRFPPRTFRFWEEPCGLRVQPDRDWASQGIDQPLPASCLAVGENWDIGGMRLVFRRHGGVAGNAAHALNRVQVFGARIAMALLLIGAALLVAPRIKVPFGAMIFACSAFLSVMALVLQGRDYFLEPHLLRFRSNVQFFYWAAVVLLGLLVPLKGTIQDRRFWKRLMGAAGLLLAAHALVSDPFDGSRFEFVPALLNLIVYFALILLVLFGVNATIGLLDASMNWWQESRSSAASFLAGVLLAAICPLGLLFVMLIAGGHEAIPLVGFRVYLPTLLLPLLALSLSFLLWRVELEADPGARRSMGLLASLAIALPITVYRLVSGDNGGTAVIVVGVLAVAWLVVGRSRPLLFVTLLGLALVGAMGASSMAERFQLAWADDAQRVLHYDAARNLRTARDMARAGGWLGQNVDLPVPALVRSNIHNDLVLSYVSGYFGWLGAGVAILALAALYNAVISGLQGLASTIPDGDVRRAMLAWAVAVSAALAVQSAWVAGASLQSMIPMTGQDLPPLSASAIAVVAFFGGLLGSAFATHNVSS